MHLHPLRRFAGILTPLPAKSRSGLLVLGFAFLMIVSHTTDAAAQIVCQDESNELREAIDAHHDCVLEAWLKHRKCLEKKQTMPTRMSTS